MSTSNRRRIALSLAIIWMVAVVVLYYWIHKPLTSPLAKSVGGAMLDSLSALFIIAIAGGIGRAIHQYLPLQTPLSRSETLALEALFGVGMVSVLMFAVGLVMLNFASILILLLILAAITRRGLRGWLGDFRGWLRGLAFQSRWEKGLGWFIILNLMMAWIMATAPPTTFDALTYHLLGAKLWVSDGHFHALAGNHFFGFPQLPNTLFAGQMALLFGRYTGAAILHGLIGALALMATGGYAARRFSRFSGFLAPAILLSATSIWLQFSWAYLDLFTAAFGMAAFIALDEWRKAEPTRRTFWLILSGTFAGLAISSKYNAAMLVGIGGLYVLVYGWQAEKWRVIRPLVIYGAVALLVFAPWLLRNLAFYDNPIYPLGNPTGEWDDLKAEFYQDAGNAPLKTHPVLILPIFIMPTIWGVEGALLYSSTIGPLFLLLIPMLLLGWKELPSRDSLKGFLLLVLLYHLAWIVTAAYSELGAATRFVYPMFPGMAVLAAVGLDGLGSLPRKPLDFAWVLRTVVALAFSLTMIAHVTGTRSKGDSGRIEGTTLVDHFVASRTLEYLVGGFDEQAYLEYRLGWYPVAMQVVNELPDKSRVLFLWETRSLYCDEPRLTCEEDAILFNWWHARRTIGDSSAEAILADWQRRGITHILVWEEGRRFEFDDNTLYEPADETEWEKIPPLLEVIWQGEDIYTLYRLPSASTEN